MNVQFVVTAAVLATTSCAVCADTLNTHEVHLDAQRKLVSWVEPQDRAYTAVIQRAWNFLFEGAPKGDNGLPAYYSYSYLKMPDLKPGFWPHNPAGLYAMLADSASSYYAFSGDRRVVDFVAKLLTYQLEHGTTPATWDWASVPYASATHGATEYIGGVESEYDLRHPGRGDGFGVIEPDKVGELGVGYLQVYQITRDPKFRDAALSCGRALARHVREGTWNESPWPFRVYAQNGLVREKYSSNVIGAIRLFDGLIESGIGEKDSFVKARATAWKWMMSFPVHNQLWSGYFEDVPIFDFPNNLNQYSPLETARYLMLHPDQDSEWQSHVRDLIGFVERHFAIDVPNEPGVQWGANAISEQIADMNKMGSHTSRYASINAMLYELTGDSAAKEKAFRSFNWATYMCRENGVVNVGPVDQTAWFSDGYGDYIRHFLAGMASVPEWVPKGESHILRSSSVVTKVEYSDGGIRYKTGVPQSEEKIRLAYRPVSVSAGGSSLRQQTVLSGEGWTWEAQTGILRVRHGAGDVVISGR